jgi:ubiquinone/menaquinone biosynthesis C-methylase UbiE
MKSEYSELEKKIKNANRQIYNNKSVEKYNENESIFNEKRQKRLNSILKNAARDAGKENFLDVGTGTGHLLTFAKEYFDNIYACDISENMLIQIKNKFPECHFFASDAEFLPIIDSSINCVTCYAMLHHLFKHDKLFEECFRILEKGGVLYTDHDPNYFLNRFYHLFYKIKHRNTPGFGSELEELAEYHNSSSSGINPEKLKKLLLNIGFSKVIIQYRISDKKHWPGIKRFIVPSLRIISKVIPAKSFFTHFSIYAVK